MRRHVVLAAAALSLVGLLLPGGAPAVLEAARTSGPAGTGDPTGPGGSPASYSVLQMNLCLSGTAGCYERTAYPSVVDEAEAQVRAHEADAVTVNEACSGDVATLARRTGYRARFSAVLAGGRWLPCTDPGGRGVFGIAVLTRRDVESWRGRAFEVHPGVEERRWLCVTTDRPTTVCSAHLGTRDSAVDRVFNDAECRELTGVLARYAAAGATVFGGDVNRRRPCAPTTMWTRGDAGASQAPGIQHLYGSTSLGRPVAETVPATYTDHDFLAVRLPEPAGDRG